MVVAAGEAVAGHVAGRPRREGGAAGHAGAGGAVLREIAAAVLHHEIAVGAAVDGGAGVVAGGAGRGGGAGGALGVGAARAGAAGVSGGGGRDGAGAARGAGAATGGAAARLAGAVRAGAAVILEAGEEADADDEGGREGARGRGTGVHRSHHELRRYQVAAVARVGHNHRGGEPAGGARRPNDCGHRVAERPGDVNTAPVITITRATSVSMHRNRGCRYGRVGAYARGDAGRRSRGSLRVDAAR